MSKKKNSKTSSSVLSDISRRKFLGTTAGVVAAGTISGFPNIVQAADPIRTIGLGVSIINEIQGKAAKDLGFGIKGQALDYGALFGKSLQQNDQFEVSECYYDMFDFMK